MDFSFQSYFFLSLLEKKEVDIRARKNISRDNPLSLLTKQFLYTPVSAALNQLPEKQQLNSLKLKPGQLYIGEYCNRFQRIFLQKRQRSNYTRSKKPKYYFWNCILPLILHQYYLMTVRHGQPRLNYQFKVTFLSSMPTLDL